MASILSKNTKWHLAQRLEKRWWQRYLKKKEVSDYLKWKKNYWKQFLETIEVLPTAIKGRVLDAGCGPAGIFCYLADLGINIDAVDPLLENYKALSHFDPKWYPTVQFATEKLEEYQSSPYPLVFCLNALNHVEDIQKSIARLFELTREGGQCIISIDTHRSKALQKVFKWIPGDVLHPHQNTLPQYEELTTNEGFTVLRKHRIKTGRIFDYWVLVCQKESPA